MSAFVNSFPKSGTNLVHKALELLGMRYGELGVADTLLHGRHRLLRKLLRGASRGETGVDVGLFARAPVSRRWLRGRFRRLREHEFITGHCAFEDTLADALAALGVAVVAVVRDPRDVLVSHVNYFVKRPDIFYSRLLSGERAADFDAVLRGGEGHGAVPVRGYFDAYERFLSWTERPEVLVVRFEELVGEQGGGSRDAQLGGLAQLAEHVGLAPDGARLAEAADVLFGGTHTFSRGQARAWVDDEDLAVCLRRNQDRFDRLAERLGYPPTHEMEPGRGAGDGSARAPAARGDAASGALAGDDAC